MYVLLNLKDGSRLSEVVQLLFSHGHTAVSVAEHVEDLCPRCESLTRKTDNGLHQPQRDSMTPSTSFTSDTKAQDQAVSSEETDLTFYGQLANSDTPSEEVEVVTECEPPWQQTKPLMPPNPIAEVKEEPVQNAQGDLDLDSGMQVARVECPSAQSSKRKARAEELGLETFQCQICKKPITRQGQYANLVNHLSRHARLHASKKQYCCPVCRASFSRRYLAYSHVREAHAKYGCLEPVDHGRELREEYRALLELCFPGASTRRKTLPQSHSTTSAETDGKNVAHSMPNIANELSRLLA
ncbi:hypothetical protein GCK32_000438 [Trichostrongylus colubriformis]|uniref:C2H2-type domain-containing protein n=1 Tax=Trichostrongylus colubriformis TaxID=6319 RepID=A0AAN8FG73_TRICO